MSRQQVEYLYNTLSSYFKKGNYKTHLKEYILSLLPSFVSLVDSQDLKISEFRLPDFNIVFTKTEKIKQNSNQYLLSFSGKLFILQ